MVYEELGPETKVHNIPFGENNVRVSVDDVIIGEALLPIPVVDEYVKVKDAKGGQVAWPKKFVLTNEEVSSRKPIGKDRVKNKDRIKQKDFPRKLVEGKKIQSKEQLNQDNICNLDCNAQSSFDSFEETLHLMYPNETDHIKFPIGKEVFAGEDMEFGYIPKRNILDVCQMKNLDSDILIVYMRCLYEKYKSSRDRFVFINPLTFSSSQTKANLLRERIQSCQGKQFALIPYNPG
ncbi:hypothetical protein FRX31_014270 [Thalictrum thalictroides]|uniref:DUF8039 domain-containing protein n=1 Tax=Thalictrum thalictroides TaxID=46969 RepID=A0A7J6WFB3_THATH|nr:hypothetical protein FRX31_014270 [Thalictrum thalictroides]